MESNVVNALCITSGIMLVGGMLGVTLLIFPHRFINLSMKIYSKFSVLGISRSDTLVDPQGKFTVAFYRIFGFVLALISAIPLLIIFYGCVLRECTSN